MDCFPSLQDSKDVEWWMRPRLFLDCEDVFWNEKFSPRLLGGVCERV